MNYINPHSKVIKHLDRLSALQKGDRCYPINAEIDLSNRCNLRCSWCDFAYTHSKSPWANKCTKPEGYIETGDLMTWLVADKILDELRGAGVTSITWTGGGEPLTNPEAVEIFKTAHELGFQQGIYTNGTLIDYHNAEALKELMTWIYISLDAYDRRGYTISKGKGFAAACHAVSMLKMIEGQATVGAGFLINCDNYRHVSEMYTLGIDLGADYIQFRPVVNYDQDMPGVVNSDSVWLENAMNYLVQLRGKAKLEFDLERFRALRHWRGHGYKRCYWAQLQTSITPNGKVWTCINKRGHRGAEIGDLTTQNFKEIWDAVPETCVNADCRILCRGHFANLTINEIMRKEPHTNFI